MCLRDDIWSENNFRFKSGNCDDDSSISTGGCGGSSSSSSN